MPRLQDADDLFSADVFDIRDVIARFEALEDDEDKDEADTAEQARIWTVLEEAKGNGGDEQWRGDWYPIAFISDRHFEDYARELAEDIGAIKDDAQWPNNCIDWKEAARQLQQDYTSIEIDDVTYWYR